MSTPEKTVLLFVDTIESGVARLLLGRASFEAPVGLLPDGAGVGDWLRVSLSVTAAPPDRSEAILDELSRKDPGGDIKL